MIRYDNNKIPIKSITISFRYVTAYVGKGYNVISIDYGNVVPYPCYIQAANNMLRVGKCFARFITTLMHTKLKSRKIKMEDIHVVGFCLGAQVAGKAGGVLANLNLHFPRISGNKILGNFLKVMLILLALDASLPLFHGVENYISKYAAAFVDAIHTNVVIFDRIKPIGHVDFYVNNPAFPGGVCKICKTIFVV